jgi:ankyrin repeat protein
MLLGEESGIPRYDAIDFIQQQSLIALLIEAGADPNSLSSDWPLIVVAAAHGNTTGALKTLLEKGADPNKTNAQGLSALHLLASPVERQALLSRPTVINDLAIRLLLKHHASAAQPDEMGECPLHWAAFGFDDLHYFHLYLSSSPDVEAALHLENHAGETLLHFASLGDRLETIEFLISRGLNVNARNSNGWTPLMCALTPGNGYVLYRGGGHIKKLQHALRTAKFLLSHGADPLIVTDEGWTPLHALALNYDDEERSGDIAGFTRDLLSRGVDPEARAPLLSSFERESYGARSVPWGRRLPAAMQDPSALRLMVKPNLAPLYWAAERGAVGVIRGLLSHGVSVSSADESEITPTRLVAESSFLQQGRLKTASVIMNLLLDAGAGF